MRNENKEYELEDDGLKTTYMQAVQCYLQIILSQFAHGNVTLSKFRTSDIIFNVISLLIDVLFFMKGFD